MKQINAGVFLFLALPVFLLVENKSFSAPSTAVSPTRSSALADKDGFVRSFEPFMSKVLKKMRRGDQWFECMKSVQLSKTEWMARANREALELFEINREDLAFLNEKEARRTFRKILSEHLANFITQRLREDGLVSDELLLESHKRLYHIQAMQIVKKTASRIGWRRVPDIEDVAYAIRFEATLLVGWTDYRRSRFATAIINYATWNAYRRLVNDGILPGNKQRIEGENVQLLDKAGDPVDPLALIAAPEDRSEDAAILLDDRIPSDMFRIYVDHEQARFRGKIRENLPWLRDEEIDLLVRLGKNELKSTLLQRTNDLGLPHTKCSEEWIVCFQKLRSILMFAAYYDVYGQCKKTTLQTAGEAVGLTREWARKLLPGADQDFLSFWTQENRYGKIADAVAARSRLERYFEAVDNDFCRQGLAQFSQ